jgi:hypothetical protein
LLHEDGLLIIAHPLVPNGVFAWFWKLLRKQGWLAGEHVNFFTPQTARLTYERSGFQILQSYFPGLNGRFTAWNWLFGQAAIQMITVCRKIEGYRYDSTRWSLFEPAWANDLRGFHGVVAPERPNQDESTSS